MQGRLRGRQLVPPRTAVTAAERRLRDAFKRLIRFEDA